MVYELYQNDPIVNPTVKVDVSSEYLLGATSIVLSGQGKVGGIERRVVVPAVTLQVVADVKGK